MELMPVDKIPMIQLQDWIRKQQSCLCSFKPLTEVDQASYNMLMHVLGKANNSNLTNALVNFGCRNYPCCCFVDSSFWITTYSECHLIHLSSAHFEHYWGRYLPVDGHTRFVAQGYSAANGGPTSDASLPSDVTRGEATIYEPISYAPKYDGVLANSSISIDLCDCSLETATASTSSSIGESTKCWHLIF